MTLKVDPNRLGIMYSRMTGVMAWAETPEGKRECVDIAQLDKESLIEFSQGTFGGRPHAEALLVAVLGHNK